MNRKKNESIHPHSMISSMDSETSILSSASSTSDTANFYSPSRTPRMSAKSRRFPRNRVEKSEKDGNVRDYDEIGHDGNLYQREFTEYEVSGYGDEEGEDEIEYEDEERFEVEEPKLKYQRLMGDVPAILEKENASCLCVSERMLALGTEKGSVYIIDYQGNQIKSHNFSRIHKKTVNEICFDLKAEYVASCSEDGSIIIHGLYSDEKEKYEYSKPIGTIAMDPNYASNNSRQIVIGDSAGKLIMISKGWFGPKDNVIHSGEGPITTVKWKGFIIAWINDMGIKLYNSQAQQKIITIKKPLVTDNIHALHLKPQLVWQDDGHFVVTWIDTVLVISVNISKIVQNSPNDPFSGQNKTKLDEKNNESPSVSGNELVEIISSLKFDFFIAGTAPFADSLVIFAVNPPALPSPMKSNGKSKSKNMSPEVKIVTRKDEEITSDSLSFSNFDNYLPYQYSMSHSPFSGSSIAGGQWMEGDEPFYFFISPKDIIYAKTRDAKDHIQWLIENNQHEIALDECSLDPSNIDLLQQVGAKYLDYLILERKYHEAAKLCPKLLRNLSHAWERWIFHFSELRQLAILAPYIPTSNPKLSPKIYELALTIFITSPSYSEHSLFLSLIKSWPCDIYSVKNILNFLKQKIHSGSSSPPLKQALAELYLSNSEYDKALQIFLQSEEELSSKPDLFDFIQKYNLYNVVKENIPQLLNVDLNKALTLLVENHEAISPSYVVNHIRGMIKSKSNVSNLSPSNSTFFSFSKSSIQAYSESDILSQTKSKLIDNRQILHQYLHKLFEKSPSVGSQFHEMQIELYAEFDKKFLLTFLRNSHYYPLDKAYEICKQRNLDKEAIFILGRMGNNKQALNLIIEKLRDIPQAIAFVSSQADEELWDELVSRAINDTELTGELLEHSVGFIDPLQLFHKIPSGLIIPRLRDRLVNIMADCHTENFLRRRCNKILKSDYVFLMEKYYQEAKKGLQLGKNELTHTFLESRNFSNLVGSFPSHFNNEPKHSVVLSNQNREFVIRDNTTVDLCSLCLDSISSQNMDIVVFFCSHAYHLSCLSQNYFDIGLIQKEEIGRLESIKSHDGGWGYGDRVGTDDDVYGAYFGSVDEMTAEGKERGEEVGVNNLKLLKCVLCSFADSITGKGWNKSMDMGTLIDSP